MSVPAPSLSLSLSLSKSAPVISSGRSRGHVGGEEKKNSCSHKHPRRPETPRLLAAVPRVWPPHSPRTFSPAPTAGGRVHPDAGQRVGLEERHAGMDGTESVRGERDCTVRRSSPAPPLHLLSSPPLPWEKLSSEFNAHNRYEEAFT